MNTSMEHDKWFLANLKHGDLDVIWEELSRGIKAGAYKPIPQHCLHCNDIQRALEDLVALKGHHSKIVLKV
jgi:hypothetical protein